MIVASVSAGQRGGLGSADRDSLYRIPIGDRPPFEVQMMNDANFEDLSLELRPDNIKTRWEDFPQWFHDAIEEMECEVEEQPPRVETFTHSFAEVSKISGINKSTLSRATNANASGVVLIRSRVESGVTKLNDRDLMRWLISRPAKGRPPKLASTATPLHARMIWQCKCGEPHADSPKPPERCFACGQRNLARFTRIPA